MAFFSNFVFYFNNVIIQITYQIQAFIEIINYTHLYYIPHETGFVFKYIIINYSRLKQILFIIIAI